MAAALAVVVLAGCGGTSTLKGKVSIDSGTQQQGLSSGPDGFGGPTSVVLATDVKISSIGADGTLSVVAQTQVNADGSYTLNVPPGDEKLVAQALDASGNVVSSAIVESTGTAGSTVTVPPMDTETTVEAAVLVQMVAQGISLAEANAIDVRARINSQISEEVKATADAGGDTQATIRGLAEAIIAAEQTQLKQLAQSGVQTSQSALFDAELKAAQALNVALDSGASASTYDDFFAGLQAALQAVGADATKQAQAESAADAAFRATVKVRIQGAGASDLVVDAAVREAIALEARATTAAVDAVLKAGSAPLSLKITEGTAEMNLKSQLSTAASVVDAAGAVASFKLSFMGSTDVSPGVVWFYLLVNPVNQADLQTIMDATNVTALALNTALVDAVNVSMRATGPVNFDGLASRVVSAYATFDNAVQGRKATLAAFGPRAQPAVDLLMVTQGAFQTY